jgi:hypothetical protein
MYRPSQHTHQKTLSFATILNNFTLKESAKWKNTPTHKTSKIVISNLRYIAVLDIS